MNYYSIAVVLKYERETYRYLCAYEYFVRTSLKPH